MLLIALFYFPFGLRKLKQPVSVLGYHVLLLFYVVLSDRCAA